MQVTRRDVMTRSQNFITLRHPFLTSKKVNVEMIRLWKSCLAVALSTRLPSSCFAMDAAGAGR